MDNITDPDIAVEDALFRKATGYTETVKKPVKCKNVEYYEDGRKSSETENIVYADVDVVKAPDTGAATFWLRNRMPERWKNKPEENRDKRDDGILPDLLEYLKNGSNNESQ